MSSAPPYKIGYGKPPKTSQFRKGQSGNPRGRKKSEENLITVFKRYASRLVRVNVNGAMTTMSMAEAVITQNLAAALKKNEVAMGNMLRLAEASGEFLDLTNPELVGRPIIVPERFSSTEEALAWEGVGVVTMPSTRKDNL